MKILLVHQNFVDHNHPGGTRHLEFARWLVQHSHDVTVITANVDYLTGNRIATTKETIDGVQVVRCYAPAIVQRGLALRTLSYVVFMASALLAGLRAGRADVVIGTSPPLFQLPAAWALARIRRVPFVLEVRDLWPEFAVAMGVLRSRWLISLARTVEQFFYRSARHIIVNSPAYRDYLLDKGIDEASVTIIPNGVEPSMFAPNANGENVRKKLKLQGKFVATYAGALGQANDIWTILRAAEELQSDRDVHFLIVGGGAQEAALRSFATEHRLDNVTFGGAFPKNEMHEVLAASDVCIATLQDIPAFRTTYPNKVFDYMAAGRPTVCAIDGVIREVVESSEGGIFVSPGDGHALSEAIMRLKNNRCEAQSMGARARAYVKSHFARNDQSAALERTLSQLA